MAVSRCGYDQHILLTPRQPGYHWYTKHFIMLNCKRVYPTKSLHNINRNFPMFCRFRYKISDVLRAITGCLAWVRGQSRFLRQISRFGWVKRQAFGLNSQPIQTLILDYTCNSGFGNANDKVSPSQTFQGYRVAVLRPSVREIGGGTLIGARKNHSVMSWWIKTLRFMFKLRTYLPAGWQNRVCYLPSKWG